MRRMVMLVAAVAAVVACSKTETPAADTSAAAMAPAPAPAPAPALTEADVAGTWTGTTMPAGSDSVVSKWTQVCAAGKCNFTEEGSKVRVASSYTLAGDSAVGTSESFSDPQMTKGAKVVDTWVAHFVGDSVSGTGTMKLASKPDSTVMTYRFAGARKR